MFCVKCGSQISDGSAFCPQCGNSVAAAPVQQVAQPAAVAQVAQPAQQVVQPMQPAQPVVQQQPAAYVQQPVQQIGAAPASQPSMRGCFGSGWDDVKNTDGWFKKVALMALINLVPIFNWVNVGYGWNWGKDLVMGKREGLPEKIVSGENFKLGFFVFVVNLVALIILYAEGFVLGLIPILGMLVAIVLDVFAAMFLLLPNIRMALFGRIGAGFEVGRLFDAYKRKLGTLFCISVVPGLAAGGIGLVIFLVFLLIAGVFAGSDLLAIMSASARYGSYNYLPSSLGYSLGGSVAIVAILFIVALYLEMIAYQFCQLVTQRAMGHYIARFAPEWAGEAAAASQAAVAAAAYAPYGQQPVAGAGVPAAPAAQPQPVVQPASPVAPATVQPVQPVAEVPAAQAAASVQGAAAAGVAAGAAVAAASVSNEPAAPAAYQAPDSYAFDETSVLPEMPEDMDTVVQPELRAQHAAPENQFDAALFQKATSEAQVPEAGDAVRLQPTVASGPLVGDDSDTLVLMEDAQAKPAPAAAQPVSGQRTLQLTRANGDTCVLSSFPVTIGKGSEADLVIDGNSAISRMHARILRDGDTFAVEDLGSTNKTFIGSYELPANTPTILSDGDVLKLANESLQVKVV